MDLLPFLQHNWALVLIALVSGSLLLWPGIAAGTRAGLSPGDAVQLINRERAVVVDVSEADEFAAGHITGARAGRAAAILRKLGYEKAHALAGGLAAWREASLPTEKAA